jgi:hypothetical protein
MVIAFPAERIHMRAGMVVDAQTEPAKVVILPVIRIERHTGSSDGFKPGATTSSGGKRRKRS